MTNVTQEWESELGPSQAHEREVLGKDELGSHEALCHEVAHYTADDARQAVLCSLHNQAKQALPYRVGQLPGSVGLKHCLGGPGYQLLQACVLHIILGAAMTCMPVKAPNALHSQARPSLKNPSEGGQETAYISCWVRLWRTGRAKRH